MSFCPLCNAGQGNGGDPCAKCEAREQRAEALTLDAKKQFAEALKGEGTCVGCETMDAIVVNLTGEQLCEECFVKQYVETEM